MKDALGVVSSLKLSDISCAFVKNAIFHNFLTALPKFHFLFEARNSESRLLLTSPIL